MIIKTFNFFFLKIMFDRPLLSHKKTRRNFAGKCTPVERVSGNRSGRRPVFFAENHLRGHPWTRQQTTANPGTYRVRRLATATGDRTLASGPFDRPKRFRSLVTVAIQPSLNGATVDISNNSFIPIIYIL